MTRGEVKCSIVGGGLVQVALECIMWTVGGAGDCVELKRGNRKGRSFSTQDPKKKNFNMSSIEAL